MNVAQAPCLKQLLNERGVDCDKSMDRPSPLTTSTRVDSIKEEVRADRVEAKSIMLICTLGRLVEKNKNKIK